MLKIIQLAAVGDSLFSLGNDGSLWQANLGVLGDVVGWTPAPLPDLGDMAALERLLRPTKP